MGARVPHPAPPPTSLPTPSRWVVPEPWLWESCFMHRTCTGHLLLRIKKMDFMVYDLYLNLKMTPLLLQLPPRLFSLRTVKLLKDWPHSLPPVSPPAGSTQTNQTLSNLAALLSSPYHILNSSAILKTMNKYPPWRQSTSTQWKFADRTECVMAVNTGSALSSGFLI